MLPETLILFGLISETETSVVQISAVTLSCATERLCVEFSVFVNVYISFSQDFQDSSHNTRKTISMVIWISKLVQIVNKKSNKQASHISAIVVIVE